MAASFGVGASLANYGSKSRSSSLTAFGEDQQTQATQELGVAASMEGARNNQNKMARAQAKQGNQQLGASSGAMIGASFGPWGALIGGVVGALAGGSISS